MNSQLPTNSQFVCVTFIVLCRQNEKKKIQRNDQLFGAGLSFHEETVESGIRAENYIMVLEC